MVKPASLWAAMKTTDPLTLGRVCASLGGQDVGELHPAESALISVISQDSEWMDERIDEQKVRWKDRQAAKRARDKKMSRDVTVTIGDNGDVTQCHGDIGDTPNVTIHPSLPPSIHPTPKGVCVYSARPTLDEVVAAAPITGVPVDFAKDWWREMESIGWVQSNGREITKRTFRASLKTWFNKSKVDGTANRTTTTDAPTGIDAEVEALAHELLKKGARK